MRGAALLVSDDPMYALGPILVADDVEEAMEGMLAFIAALEADPSEMPTIRLMVEWQGFLGAITGTVVAVPLGAQESQSGDPSAQAGESSPETPTGPTSPDDGSEDADESLPDDLRVGDDLDDNQLAQVAAELAPDSDQADEPAENGATPAPPEADPDPEPDEGEDEDDELQLAERLASIPGGTPRQRGKVECFACSGTGVAVGTTDTECNLCHGEGKIDEPEPAAPITSEGAPA